MKLLSAKKKYQSNKKNLEDEILKDFQGKYKNRTAKLSFLKKVARAELYVSKTTGVIIPSKINSSLKNLKEWGRRYKSKFYSSNSPHFFSRHAYTVSIVKDKLNKKINIADLGCGNGSLIEILNKFYGLNKIHGFEHSKETNKKNIKKFKDKKIKFINSSIEEINEKKFKEYFDLIFLTWTLGSSSRPDILMNKIYKILKPNGHLVISESSRILVRPKVSIFWYFNNFNTFKSYPWRFSFNSLRNLLLMYNFKVVGSNNYKYNENLVLVGKKFKFISNKKYKFDDFREIIKFFKIWLKESKSMKRYEEKHF